MSTAMTAQSSGLFSVTIQKGKLGGGFREHVASLKPGQIISLGADKTADIDLSRTLLPHCGLLDIISKNGESHQLKEPTIEAARRHAFSHPDAVHVYKVTQDARTLFEISSVNRRKTPNRLTQIFGPNAEFQVVEDPRERLNIHYRTFEVQEL